MREPKLQSKGVEFERRRCLPARVGLMKDTIQLDYGKCRTKCFKWKENYSFLSRSREKIFGQNLGQNDLSSPTGFSSITSLEKEIKIKHNIAHTAPQGDINKSYVPPQSRKWFELLYFTQLNQKWQKSPFDAAWPFFGVCFHVWVSCCRLLSYKGHSCTVYGHQAHALRQCAWGRSVLPVSLSQSEFKLKQTLAQSICLLGWHWSAIARHIRTYMEKTANVG